MLSSFKIYLAAQILLRSRKREFIAENHTLVQNIQRGCELMQLPRRSYYYKWEEKPSDEALKARIGDICQEFSRY